MDQLRHSVIYSGEMVIMTRKSRERNSDFLLPFLNFSAVEENNGGFSHVHITSWLIGYINVMAYKNSTYEIRDEFRFSNNLF
jgi:hypothetical protein